jgi:adenosylcobinamide kinase/adenosylcobinamide-phosphate guanylyltransferase
MNLLMTDDEQKTHELESLLAVLSKLTSSVIFVSNEVGMGIVPLGEESRRFVDEAGWLHQRLAAQCHRVTQMVAGIPNVIKDAH